MPREGLDRRAYRSAKFGSWEKSQALDAQVTEAGASAGLVFRHDLMATTPNTVASHALIRLAHETGDATMQDRVVEALFSAYFTQGLDVGDHAVLADLAEGAGIKRSRASAFLSEPASFDAVIEDEKLARGLGLNGVPSFVLGGNYLFWERSRACARQGASVARRTCWCALAGHSRRPTAGSCPTTF